MEHRLNRVELLFYHELRQAFQSELDSGKFTDRDILMMVAQMANWDGTRVSFSFSREELIRSQPIIRECLSIMRDIRDRVLFQMSSEEVLQDSDTDVHVARYVDSATRVRWLNAMLYNQVMVMLRGMDPNSPSLKSDQKAVIDAFLSTARVIHNHEKFQPPPSDEQTIYITPAVKEIAEREEASEEAAEDT